VTGWMSWPVWAESWRWPWQAAIAAPALVLPFAAKQLVALLFHPAVPPCCASAAPVLLLTWGS
jgi:hypothetical protein